ncbi:hypothetical protein [Haloimpatiens massiliensis]|uniref:hypothetical protein n=1 Tax=Haloimpatiens massiliensis TaxID=1658110 RepID=UPI000C8343C4|nr:hypothetical protein [Haloimpatiens massiliensis]
MIDISELAAITIRLAKETCENFKELAKSKDISQGKFLGDLVDMYNKSQSKENPLIEQSSNNKIRLLLRYQNEFTEDENRRMLEPKVYEFKGEDIFTLQQGRNIEVIDSIQSLKEEFNINNSLEDYYCGYWFGIFNDLEKTRYVVNEWIWITDKYSKKTKLSVRRCKFANNLMDIVNCIEKYAFIGDVENVEYLLAKKIDDDQEIEMFK